MDAIAWLTVTREKLEEFPGKPVRQVRAIYQMVSTKRVATASLHGVVEAVKSYKNSDLPLSVKIAIPATLGMLPLIAGHGVGIAAFGTAIGTPAILVVFIGVAGVSAILEALLGKSDSTSYISMILAMAARDEILRRVRNDLREAMVAEPFEPIRQDCPSEATQLHERLRCMDPFDFERHVMSFFLDAGLPAWNTKRSNDAGVDGFARHPKGVIVVQCKRYAEDHRVSRPDVQRLKGVIEENGAWRGYFVTTSSFSTYAKESADSSDGRLVLVDVDLLTQWHSDGLTVK